MSAKPAAAPAEGAAPKKSKKMLFIIIAAVLVLGGGGAGGYMMMAKKGGKADKHAKADKASKEDAEDGHGDDGDDDEEAPKKDKHPSVFSALEPFTVNLADKDRERYLQVGLTYEVASKEVEDDFKNQLPLVRSQILLLLTSKTATELATPEGKTKLTGELVALGRAAMKGQKSAKGKTRGITNVHFSAMIIQ